MSEHPFTEQASVHPKTVTALSEGKVSPLKKQARRVGYEPRDPSWELKVHPKVWSVAMLACGGDAKRIQIVSETEVVVWNNADWRSRE